MITVTLYMKALALILHVARAFFFLVNMKVYFINDNAVNNYIQKKKNSNLWTLLYQNPVCYQGTDDIQ